MKERAKTVEVIATRDENGTLCVWDGRCAVEYGYEYDEEIMVWSSDGIDTGMITCDVSGFSPARALLGGTYCGIRKGGIKRLRITTIVKEA